MLKKYRAFPRDVNGSQLEIMLLLSTIPCVKTIMVAGLGNPGPEYENTRHNVGFMAADAIAHSFRMRRFNHNRLADWSVSEVALCDGQEPVKIVLVKPQTFMNNSGVAVAAFVSQHQVLLENLIIVHDEMDLPVGSLRVSFNASSAGHKGVLSIAEHLGSKGFVRLRLGIGKPDEPSEVIDHVLSRFSRSELPVMIDTIAKTPAAVRMVVCDGVMAAQDTFNRRVTPR